MKMETHRLVRDYQYHELNLDFFEIGGIFLLFPNLKPQVEAQRNPGGPVENAGLSPITLPAPWAALG